MDRVFLVMHVHDLPTGEEDFKLIGVYPTERAAEDAVIRAKQLPGFRDALDGFSIEPYSVGKDQWTEGFVTVAG